jgi:16S rRNA (adenine1518-N6/adenine1519-N6)-dimethyltransferase
LSSKRAEIIEKLKAMGAEPKRSLGQNFLVSSHVIDKIVTAVQAGDPVALVEVGPGLGALTEGLSQLNKPLLLLELDRRFAGHWRSRGFKVIEGDALALDWGTLGLVPGTTLVSNLPYQISSSLVIERSIAPYGVSRMILMFQKEVAQRLMARARTKDYGLLSVIAQTFWDIRLLLEAGPSDFYPPPNVASRVLVFSEARPEGMKDPGEFLRFCKAAFAQRRKLMVKNLLVRRR